MEKNHQRNTLKLILLLLLINISFSFVAASQCNNGIDDDNDGLFDALVELDPNNNEDYTVATNNPWEILTVTREQSGEALSSCAGGLLRHRTAGWGDLTNDEIHPTAKKICNLVGYANVKDTECRHTGSDNRCNFYSPGDNCMWYWDGTKFSSENAQSKYYKSWISTLVCEDRLAACNDGIDNDGNGLTDMDDPGCASENDDSEIQHDPDCKNPADDDESTPECVQTSDCSIQNYNSQNMCDGNTLYYNSYTYGCSSGNCEEDTTRVDVTVCENSCSSGACIEIKECEDNEDNDGDGKIDENDPGCWDNNQDPESYNPNLDDESRFDLAVCSDGIDNDGDGKTDMDDNGCESPYDDSEIDCVFDFQCGTDMFILGTETCTSSNLFADHTYNTCENPGQNNAQCTQTIFSILKQDCGTSSCEDPQTPYCSGDTVYYNQICQNKGCSSGSCTSNTVQNTIEVATCEFGCTAGACDDFVDENGPEITLLTPEDSSTQHNTVQFNYTTTDESAVKSCSLTINDIIQDSSNNIAQGTNTFSKLLNQTNQHYTWLIGCYDIYENYAQSKTQTFYYTDSYCEQTSDCQEATENLICDGDDVVKETITPLCQANNTCAQNTEHEFIKDCKNGCLNGHCRSDKKKKIDDDVPPIINTAPLVQLFDDYTSSIALGNATVLGVKKAQNIDWIFILLFLLFAGIILLLLLIFYIILR